MAEQAADAPEKASSYPKPAYSWYCLGIIIFAYLFGFMDRIIIGFLTDPIKADLGFTDEQMGLVTGIAFALFYTLFGIPIGWAADRKNRKIMLGIGTAIWSLATAACGFAKGFWSMFIARVWVGVGEATINPCGSSLIGDLFPPKTRPRAFGLFTMATAFGTGLSFIAGGALLGFFGVNPNGGATYVLPVFGEVLSWQAVFIVVGLAGLLPAALLLFTVKEPARQELRGDKAGASWAETKEFLITNWKMLICHHLGVAFIVMAVYGWVNWLAPYFGRVHGWSVPEYAFIYGLFGGLTGIISAVSSGYVTNWFKDKGFDDGAMRTVLVGGIGLSLITGVAPLVPDPMLSLWCFIIGGLFANWPPAQALAALAETTPNQLRGLVVSIYIFVIGIFGAGLGPLVMGTMSTRVFGEDKLNLAMSSVTLFFGLLGAILIFIGLKQFRHSLDRVDWR